MFLVWPHYSIGSSKNEIPVCGLDNIGYCLGSSSGEQDKASHPALEQYLPQIVCSTVPENIFRRLKTQGRKKQNNLLLIGSNSWCQNLSATDWVMWLCPWQRHARRIALNNTGCCSSSRFMQKLSSLSSHWQHRLEIVGWDEMARETPKTCFQSVSFRVYNICSKLLSAAPWV